MLRFQLDHYGTGSVITCLDDLKHISAITYTRKIHRYESEADFSTIKTELITYGEVAGYEIYNYFRCSKNRMGTAKNKGNTRHTVSVGLDHRNNNDN